MLKWYELMDFMWNWICGWEEGTGDFGLLYFRLEEATESMQIPHPVIKRISCAVKTFVTYGKLVEWVRLIEEHGNIP
jgi:hypothetical protein